MAHGAAPLKAADRGLCSNYNDACACASCQATMCSVFLRFLPPSQLNNVIVIGGGVNTRILPIQSLDLLTMMGWLTIPRTNEEDGVFSDAPSVNELVEAPIPSSVLYIHPFQV